MTKKSKNAVSAPPTKGRNLTRSEMALESSINTAMVIHEYQKNLHGPDVDIVDLIEGLRDTCGKVKDGDMSHLESMLIGQAKALETMFASLVRRSQAQEYQKNFVSFLTLALKAQAQSRATIQAVVDLKYPRQVSFVKQANISNGPQQVNNAAGSGTLIRSDSHAEENRSLQNKLLEDSSDERTQLDKRTTTATIRSHQTVDTVGKVNGSNQHRGQG